MTHNYVAELQEKFPHPLHKKEELEALASELENLLVQFKQEAQEHPSPELSEQARYLFDATLDMISPSFFGIKEPVVTKIFNVCNGFARAAKK